MEGNEIIRWITFTAVCLEYLVPVAAAFPSGAEVLTQSSSGVNGEGGWVGGVVWGYRCAMSLSNGSPGFLSMCTRIPVAPGAGGGDPRQGPHLERTCQAEAPKTSRGCSDIHHGRPAK